MTKKPIDFSRTRHLNRLPPDLRPGSRANAKVLRQWLQKFLTEFAPPPKVLSFQEPPGQRDYRDAYERLVNKLERARLEVAMLLNQDLNVLATLREAVEDARARRDRMGSPNANPRRSKGMNDQWDEWNDIYLTLHKHLEQYERGDRLSRNQIVADLVSYQFARGRYVDVR